MAHQLTGEELQALRSPLLDLPGDTAALDALKRILENQFAALEILRTLANESCPGTPAREVELKENNHLPHGHSDASQDTAPS